MCSILLLSDATFGNWPNLSAKESSCNYAFPDNLLLFTWNLGKGRKKCFIFASSPCLSATSTGFLQGLDNTNGGVCRTKSMKLVLRVGQSKSFAFTCLCRHMCGWNERTHKHINIHVVIWQIEPAVYFRLLHIESNNIISRLELLSGHIILWSSIYSLEERFLSWIIPNP